MNNQKSARLTRWVELKRAQLVEELTMIWEGEEDGEEMIREELEAWDRLWEEEEGDE